MMDARDMIDRYLDERMSCDEEQEFFRYLRSGDFPEEFRDEQEMILQMATMGSGQELPAGMEERLSAMIDGLDEESSAPAKRVLRLELRHIWRAAAIVAVVATTGLAVVQYSNVRDDAFIAARDKDTYATPEEALPHAKAILRDLATVTSSTRSSAAEVGNDIKKLSIIIKRRQQ